MTGTALVSRQTMLQDALINVAAGLNVGKAKTAGDRFVLRLLHPHECDAMYRSDAISRKIVDMPVTDALKAGRIWQTKGDLTKTIEAAEKKWAVWPKLARGLKMGRLHGGGVILITVSGDNPMLPLGKIGKGQLAALTHLTVHEIQPFGELNRDPRQPNFRLPDYYLLNTGDMSTSAVVHHSRVIRFPGRARPDPHAAYDGWDDPELQVVYSAVHRVELVQASFAALAHEAKNDTLGIKNLQSQANGADQGAALMKRLITADMIKSVNNLIVHDMDSEKFERLAINFTGHPAFIEVYMQALAGAADIPATKLWGKAPGGLNSTGDGDLQNYHERLASDQKDIIRPVLEQLDNVVFQDATGSPVPEDAIYDFGAIREMTAKELADIAKTKADATKVYIDAGVFPSGEELFELVSDQLIEDGTYPGLENYRAKLRSAIATQVEESKALVAEERETKALPAPSAARDVRHFPRLPALT